MVRLFNPGSRAGSRAVLVSILLLTLVVPVAALEQATVPMQPMSEAEMISTKSSGALEEAVAD